MEIRITLTDYLRALQVAIDQNDWSVYRALESIIQARVQYGFGPRHYALFELHSVPRSRWNEYLLDRATNPIIRQINGRFHELARNKVEFTAHCLENALETVPILFVLNPRAVGRQSKFLTISSLIDWRAAMNAAPNEIFLKLASGAHGAEAFVARRSGVGWEFLGISGTAERLYEHCMQSNSGQGEWVVQPVVKPHRNLAAFMPGDSLGTVRAVTFWNGKHAELFLPLMRIPAFGNVTDNFSSGTVGNLVAPIDAESGSLGCARMPRSKHWPSIVRVASHPETGAPIEGVRVPMWREVRELILRGQTLTTQLPTIGWDIAVTDAGPLVVEANSAYDVNLLQVAHGRGVKEVLRGILSLRDPPAEGGEEKRC